MVASSYPVGDDGSREDLCGFPWARQATSARSRLELTGAMGEVDTLSKTLDFRKKANDSV